MIQRANSDHSSSTRAFSLLWLQLALLKRLLEMPIVNLDSPSFGIDRNHLGIGQPFLRQNIGHEIHRMFAVVRYDQPQNQRRQLLRRRVIGPEIHRVTGFFEVPEFLQQPDVRTDADEE